MLPPLSVSASAAMEMPSLSRSPPMVVYRKLTVDPDADRKAAWRAREPTVSASRGDPVTVTAWLKVTVTSM